MADAKKCANPACTCIPENKAPSSHADSSGPSVAERTSSCPMSGVVE